MKALNTFLVKVVTLLFYGHAVVAQHCSKNCSPFNFTCASSMSPSFGVEVGGTVVKIDNGPSGGCPLRFDAEIFCRFENNDKSFSQIVPGILVRSRINTIECVSPFSGQPMSVKVSYAAIRNNCDLDKATFFEVDEEFEYIGARAGLIIGNTPPSTPDMAPVSFPDSEPQGFPDMAPVSFPDIEPQEFPDIAPVSFPDSEPQGFSSMAPVSFPDSEPQGLPDMAPSTPSSASFSSLQNTIPPTNTPYYYGPRRHLEDSNEVGEPTDLQFFFAGDMIQAEWSSDALRLSTFREYARESYYYNEGGYTSGEFNSFYDFTVNVEILAYDARADANHSPFVKIQSFNQSSADSNTTTFVLDDATVSPFMIPWGSNDNMVAVILIRVVASSTQFWNEDNPNAPWILATRTSKLVGVLPRSMEENTGECPILYNQDCDSIDDPNPCPPSHAIALEDSTFSPDNSCPWPSGNNSCDPSLDLELDFCITSCLSPNRFLERPFCSYYFEFDGCEFNEDTFDEMDGCPCASSHPGAAGCVNDELTQCCYTETGALITEYDDGAGRPKCVQSGVTSIDSVDTFLFDTLPYLLCCGLNELDDSCERYYNALPDNFLEGDYENPTTAAVSFGDPHLVTFDRVNYNLNGFGEYVAVCGGPATLDEDAVRMLCSTSRRRLQEDDERTSIHFRFRPFLLGNDQMATINAGIAIQDPSFNEGTKRLTIILSSSERLIAYEGDTPIDNFTGRGSFVRYRSPGGLIISKPRDTNRTTRRNFVMVIRFTSGLRVKISESGGAMNPTITRPKKDDGKGKRHIFQRQIWVNVIELGMQQGVGVGVCEYHIFDMGDYEKDEQILILECGLGGQVIWRQLWRLSRVERLDVKVDMS